MTGAANDRRLRAGDLGGRPVGDDVEVVGVLLAENDQRRLGDLRESLRGRRIVEPDDRARVRLSLARGHDDVESAQRSGTAPSAPADVRP